MYVTPIKLDLLLNTNQISCSKGKDPDTVQNGHIYSSVKGGSIHIFGVLHVFYGLG